MLGLISHDLLLCPRKNNVSDFPSSMMLFLIEVMASVYSDKEEMEIQSSFNMLSSLVFMFNYVEITFSSYFMFVYY